MTAGASRRWLTSALAVSVGCALLVAFATRSDPRLSPDSITYLSTAAHIRSGQGLIDMTGTALSVFPPLYPLLLAPGGASLVWVRIVSVVLAGVCTWLLALLLRDRVGHGVGLVAAACFGASFGMVLVTSSTVSEPLCIAFTLATLVALAREPLTLRWCAIAGALSAMTFLTRYAGIGTIATALVVVAFATRRVKPVLVTGGVAGALSGAWLLRNLIASGTIMGPRFAGGTIETLRSRLEFPIRSIGIATGVGTDGPTFLVGVTVLGVIVVGAVIALWRRPWNTVDVAMLCLAVTSVAVPILARARTASDVSPRVMTPVLVSAAWFGAVTVDAALRRARGDVARIAIATGAVTAVVWVMAAGAAYAEHFPQLPSSGDRNLYSERLYDEIEALPADTHIITNYPWGVWWMTRREPVQMAFLRPNRGNSHRPISSDELLRLACDGPTALAWFETAFNTFGESPQERRPDLMEIVDLELTAKVPGGTLWSVTPADPSTCPSP